MQTIIIIFICLVFAVICEIALIVLFAKEVPEDAFEEPTNKNEETK